MLTATYHPPAGMFGLGAEPPTLVPSPGLQPHDDLNNPDSRVAMGIMIAFGVVALAAGVVKAIFYFKAEADARAVAMRLIDAKYGNPVDKRARTAFGGAGIKRLKGKSLDREIERLYYEVGQNVQVNIMDIEKIFKAGRNAYETGADMRTAVKAAVQKYGIR